VVFALRPDFCSSKFGVAGWLHDVGRYAHRHGTIRWPDVPQRKKSFLENDTLTENARTDFLEWSQGRSFAKQVQCAMLNVSPLVTGRTITGINESGLIADDIQTYSAIRRLPCGVILIMVCGL